MTDTKHRARWTWKRIICAIRGCRFDGWTDAGAWRREDGGLELPMAYCARCNWEL